MLKVGLLGAGRIGQVHAVNIAAHAGSVLAAVSDVNADAATTLADRFGAKMRASEDILSDDSIDAVLIATSTDTHSDFIEAATRAGKAVLCEKPVDLSLARARACLDVANATGRPVMIGFNRRFDPNFAANGMIYLSFAEIEGGKAGTAVARARLVREDGPPRLEDTQVIFRITGKTGSTRHFGSRLVFAPDGMLFVTLGDRGDMERAQDTADHAGSVIRIAPDGTVPADNPFIDGSGLPEIWSIGHRNLQGAAINPATGALWTVEHGARGGDEINIPRAGRNYGWPVISYGRHYSGGKIGIGTAKEGMEQPVHYWDPSIAPSGMAFYTGDRFPAWTGDVFVGALRGAHVARLALDGDSVAAEETLFDELGERIRDIRQGPDGYLYLVTDSGDGRILRVVPAE